MDAATCLLRCIRRTLCPALCSLLPKRHPIAPAPTTAIRKSSDLPLRIELCPFVFVHSEDVLFLREYSLANIICKVLKCLLDHRSSVRVAFRKPRCKVGIQSDNVMKHEHLSITESSGSNPDRRN